MFFGYYWGLKSQRVSACNGVKLQIIFNLMYIFLKRPVFLPTKSNKRQ